MLLLRHASAGERLSSPAQDRVRPLDRAGRAQARRLAQALAHHAIERIVTSPHTRCVETVRPLAEARGLALECREELLPDASARDTRALLDALPEATLLCTHREVFERLFRGAVTCEKGGAWVLRRRGRAWSPAAYLSPPERARTRAAIALGGA